MEQLFFGSGLNEACTTNQTHPSSFGCSSLGARFNLVK